MSASSVSSDQAWAVPVCELGVFWRVCVMQICQVLVALCLLKCYQAVGAIFGGVPEVVIAYRNCSSNIFMSEVSMRATVCCDETTNQGFNCVVS